MGTESGIEPLTDLQDYHDTLDSENITFVDTVNNEIVAVIETTPKLE